MQSAAELAALDVMRADRIDGSSEVRGGNYERLDVHVIGSGDPRRLLAHYDISRRHINLVANGAKRTLSRVYECTGLGNEANNPKLLKSVRATSSCPWCAHLWSG
jgi:hypothetical protein